MSDLRLVRFGATAALVVLAGRSVAYAASPSPLAVRLRGEAGGPRLPVVVVVSLAAGLAVSAAVVWLAALGVREQRVVAAEPFVALPRLRPRRVVLRAGLLWLLACAAFAALESYLHWRAGLGWHGLSCLTGPVHRDALPILAALALVASALQTAVEHVLAWMRRTIVRLRARRRSGAPLPRERRPVLGLVPAPAGCGTPFARGPPSATR